jgi:hypothetical protein
MDVLLKRLSQTIEAWCVVENLENKAPFFRLKVTPADISKINTIEKGNFFLSLNIQGKPTEIIVDPKLVFGEFTSFELPQGFITNKKFRVERHQLTEGFTPCAFSYSQLALAPGKEFELLSAIGQAESISALAEIKNKFSKNYVEAKYQENQKLLQDITSPLQTTSSSKTFDLYCRQTFLDNVLRGGLPLSLGGKTIYTYYRKHGDMERDYNDFKLMPTYFSQGDGNYRDINQNRRNDVFINPEVAESNIQRFFNLVQLDGYNPLVVMGSRHLLKNADKIIKKHLNNPPAYFADLLQKPFLLGAVFKGLEKSDASYKTSREELASDLISESDLVEGAAHGEGFWIDHFFYNTDLLESFECVFPDKMGDLLFRLNEFTFFDNDHVVAERKDKYQKVDGVVRQYGSVKLDLEKSELINGRLEDKNLVRTNFGKDGIYKTNLASKILCAIANKAASFDAEGIGLEMEADKPDWYDALNGLPALFGSSLSETLELKRICRFLEKYIGADLKIAIAEEIKLFIDSLNEKLPLPNFKFWEEAGQIKEDFRKKTKLGVSGKNQGLDGKKIAEFLDAIIKKCDLATKKCLDKYGNYYTYFINDLIDYEINKDGAVKPVKSTQWPLPLFLEGFVHALKVEKDKKIYKSVKKSPLYDQKLKMYKVNAPLKETPLEIGRARVFTPGWLENESIWLHMEYKYMLELLKSGMREEFYSDLKNILVPFLNPQKYKRSILENSSFIVSGAHPDRESHGRGFIARLSGSTAEFIDMWLVMMTGKNIFSLDEKGKLVFKLSPVLPAWLFKNGKLSFKLLGSIDVTYLNAKEKNTYNGGVKPAVYKLIFEDKEIEVKKALIEEPYASQIRDRKVKKIMVTLS